MLIGRVCKEIRHVVQGADWRISSPRKLGRNCIADAGGMSQCEFLESLKEDHVDHANHLAGIDVKNGAAAIAGICRRIQLKNPECPAFHLLNELWVKLP